MERFIKGFGGMVLGGLLLAACNGGTGTEDSGTPITDADLLGIWSVLSVHEKGTEKTTLPGQAPLVENTDTTTTYPAGTATMEFKANSACEVKMGFTIPCTWSTSGSTVTVITSFFGQADTAKSTVTLNGKSATLVERDKSTRTLEGGIVMETDMVTTIKAEKQ